ncbi:MAG TPA: hypothetical protein VJ476_06370 [Rhizomicrobium sp.]|nr:hypothetical protein [Rhizomicrobium sp.]
MSGMRRVAILAVLTMALPATAQPLNVQTINFDLWCQETQHLAPDRCDKRLPQDEAAFEDYRAKVEKYEVPYLEGQQTGAQLNRTILHADPIDNPVDKDPAAASQQPVSPAEHPQP